MARYVCVHGHFYQPPRENPWLEAIEIQDSAYPYHDWNERVSAECYAPNAASRILDGGGRIVDIVNNYSRMSFNFGPTLLAWMERHAPAVYRAILEADRRSGERFSGHGSALAQAHSHLILPLANRRDQVTQVAWGKQDFEHRFGRSAEGMWLPETAVDLGTLEILAAQGIRFTILAPHQARRVRPLTGGEWREVGERVDPSRAYLCRLPSGRSIALFFYDGPISRGVAFEGLLGDGEAFAGRLLSGFDDRRRWAQLVHIATDGESYGHHHRHGEMALSYALHRLEETGTPLTNYGEFLSRHPPEMEAEVREASSWSCPHGVERWRSDCGCRTGGEPGWNQRWRAPLREALDWLRDALAPRFEAAAGELLADPWRARDAYAAVLLDRSPEGLDRFFAAEAARGLTGAERVRALKLLELERHALYMYTSCGWFFSELSGIETVQVIQYADRAVQLAEELFGDSLEAGFMERLSRAESNVPSSGNGRRVYQRAVIPARVDLRRVGAHYAVSSLFEDYPEEVGIYCYRVVRRAARVEKAGRVKLAVGRIAVTSEITRDAQELAFGVLHLGDHQVHGGVREFRGEDEFETMAGEVTKPFARADFAGVLRLLDHHLAELTYSLRSLFRDEQRRVVGQILHTTLAALEAQFREIYADQVPLMRFLSDLGMPLPEAFRDVAQVVINRDLRRVFEERRGDLGAAETLLAETGDWGLELDTAGLRFALEQTIESLAEELRRAPDDREILRALKARVDLALTLPFAANLWEAQNACFGILKQDFDAMVTRAAQDDEAAAWVEEFRELAAALSVRVP